MKALTGLKPIAPSYTCGVMLTLQTIALASLLASSLTSVAESSNLKITVEREVLLEPGNAGTAHVIVTTGDGGFIVAGSVLTDDAHGNTWATRVTTKGDVVWSIRKAKGEFVGALMLADDSVLLCGTKHAEKIGGDQVGYLVRVDASGKLLAEQSLYPNADKQFGYSAINRCFPWGDGFALVGGVAHDPHGLGWVIKLNRQGMKEWEKVDSDVGGYDAIETVDHDLVTRNAGPRDFTTTVRRFNSRGELIATRDIEGLGNALMGSIGASTNAYCVTSAFPSGKQTLWTLDRDLHDASPARRIDTVTSDNRNGRGFVYPDLSFAIFGFAHDGAAISYVRFNSKLQAEYHFRQGEGSIWVNDAVVLPSGTDFVAVREWGYSQEKRGIMMDWVSIK